MLCRMEPQTNYHQALDHLAAVQAASDRLTNLYASPSTEATGRRIAECHQSIGRGLKVAHVKATLAVAEEIAGLAQELRDRLPLTLPIGISYDASGVQS